MRVRYWVSQFTLEISSKNSSSIYIRSNVHYGSTSPITPISTIPQRLTTLRHSHVPDTKNPHIRVIQRRLSVYCTPRASCITFNESIQQLSASCTAKLCQANRVKHVFNQVTLLITVNVLVMSKIDYCSVIWSSTSETTSRKYNFSRILKPELLLGGKSWMALLRLFVN